MMLRSGNNRFVTRKIVSTIISMFRYSLEFSSNGHTYTIANFSSNTPASHFEYQGNIATVMHHRIGSTYQLQLTGELLSKILEWRIENPQIVSYEPSNTVVVLSADTQLGKVLNGNVIMKNLPLYSPSTKRQHRIM